MTDIKRQDEKAWIALGAEHYDAGNDKGIYAAQLGRGMLDIRSDRSKKVYRALLNTLLLLSAVFFFLYTVKRRPRYSEDSVCHYPAQDESWKHPRLIQFSSNPEEAEWMAPKVLEYLTQLRDMVDEEGKWAAVKVQDVDILAVRNASAALLTGVSDNAIRALAGRNGYQVGYKDITFKPLYSSQEVSKPPEEPDAVPYKPVNSSAHPEYKDLIDMVSGDELRYIVGNLSSFKTRYYRSPNAKASPEYIYNYMSNLPNASVSYWDNKFFKQPNVITRLAPPDATSNSSTILLGGHLDSTSSLPFFKAPGADDDASGTAVMMHVLSILSRSGWIHTKAKYPIEGHAYAGEEGGLLGSSAIAHGYKTQNRQIRGMLNLEMVGWQPEKDGSSTITVLIDPNEEMSRYMEDVIGEYVPTAVVRSTTCGYGCSDHYSFSSLGYPVVCLASYGPNDPQLNPNYHSTTDTIDKLDFERMADFARASLAWVVQVGSL